MKTHEIIISETADECLFNIAYYIALDNPVRSETFVDEMVESLSKTLSVFPLAGKVYSDMNFNFEMRSLAYKNYVCFYKVTGDVVEILFIFNSAQNIKNILTAVEHPST